MSEILEILLEQERELQFNRFDSTTAWRLGAWIVGKARGESLPIAVDITVAGRRLFSWSSNGASLDNEAWIERKKRSVARFGHSSYYLGRRLAEAGETAARTHYVDETEFAFHGGSFPLILRGTGVVGSVTISGLKQEEDHDLAVQAIAWILRKQNSVRRLPPFSDAR